MRHLLLISLSLFIFSCGSETTAVVADTETVDSVALEQPSSPEGAVVSRGLEPAEVEAPGEAGPMAAIRKEYARIQAALEAGTLRKDSIPYLCEDAMIEGQVDLYSDTGGVVLAVHGFSQGSHSGTTEHYYFRNGQPIFLYRESGAWQFGGSMQTMEDGSEMPGTIDNMTEDRLYFHEGSTIKALTKAYEIRSGQDVDPGTIPNEAMAHNGELPESLGLIQSVMVTRTVDCKLMEEL